MYGLQILYKWFAKKILGCLVLENSLCSPYFHYNCRFWGLSCLLLGFHNTVRADPLALSSSPGHPLHCSWVTFPLGSVHVPHFLYSYGSAMMAPQDKTLNSSAWHACPYQPAQPHLLTFSSHVSCSRTVELLEVGCVPYASYLSRWFPAILVAC